ncbi:hypothetical protein F4779DRAFT_496714 [Xylariaceae sp. FL0662B]|nr:hypothetical protein F4779DRAFT_496714 [Xylariaceae sp. FL0662B]
MPSLRFILATASLFVSSIRADYVIDPDSVSLTVRDKWCQDEKATCPLICQQTPPGTTLINTCDPEQLTYGCLCGDNKQPNVSEYSLTLPYYVCQEWGTQCVAGCGQDNQCAASCQQDHPCGALNPQGPNKTSSTIPSATASGTQSSDPNAVYTGLGGSDSSDSNNNDNAAFRVGGENGSLVGFAILAASVCLGTLLL